MKTNPKQTNKTFCTFFPSIFLAPTRKKNCSNSPQQQSLFPWQYIMLGLIQAALHACVQVAQTKSGNLVKETQS